MIDQIKNILNSLDAAIDMARDKAKAAVASLAAEMAGAADDGSMSQTSLLNAIRSQVGVALVETERFDSAVWGPLGIAENYAKSLAKPPSGSLS